MRSMVLGPVRLMEPGIYMTAGRPRRQLEHQILEHAYWTRRRVRELIVDAATPDGMGEDHEDMLGRLKADLLPLTFRPLRAADGHVEAVLGEYLAGKSWEYIVEHCDTYDIAYDAKGKPKVVVRAVTMAEARRWVSESKRRLYLTSFVDGFSPSELRSYAEYLHLSERRAYELQEQFIHFVAADLAREPLWRQCHDGHKAGAGDGKTPICDRRLPLPAPRCPSCQILRIFDHYGNPRFTDEQLGDGREAGSQAPIWKTDGEYVGGECTEDEARA